MRIFLWSPTSGFIRHPLASRIDDALGRHNSGAVFYGLSRSGKSQVSSHFELSAAQVIPLRHSEEDPQ